MHPPYRLGAAGDHRLEVLWEDGERILHRRIYEHADDGPATMLVALSAGESPNPDSLARLAHEYGLKDHIDSTWAARPLELVRERGQTMLVMEDPGGELLAHRISGPMDVSQFLRLALSLSTALGALHESGLIHKDIKPTNIIVGAATNSAWFTGFGIASRATRERNTPAPPEMIAGTFAYMAPEQTGRMNRSIDPRSDLYSLGVTFYEMLTGVLPFTASEPIEWIHCHIARQPVPPAERISGIPQPASAVVMKLLAKAAEDRYQTAAGLQVDLRRCLSEWEASQRILPFRLGEHDASNELRFKEKLYGRETEIECLIAAFDRVVSRRTSELVLVSGYSGIGKSSIVNELHKVLVPSHSLFAAGKFDQYKRDIPYATLSQAFLGLVRQLLSKNESELTHWRDALTEALGSHGQLMINLIPELALIIGKQPSVPDLPPSEAQSRFLLAFRRFLGVFARPEHPLILFLDDLQWLDSATLDVFEHLASEPEIRNLLLVGAYRDNEVDSAHPLTSRLEIIRAAGGRVQDIPLGAIRREDVARMVADALETEKQKVSPLATSVFDKTAGNPFFTIQFVSALADEELLTYETRTSTWRWDLDRVSARGVTDNVVDLMVERLRRLPTASLDALKQLACIGGSVEATALCQVIGTSREESQKLLEDALLAGLLIQSGDTYAFAHDRVQEAAYALIPEAFRPEAHLRIGRLLLIHTPPQKREEAIFEIVNQLNRGAALITAQDERQDLAECNLIAAKRARNSTAYAAALHYVAAGGTLLPEDRWYQNYKLTYTLALAQAECEYLVGNIAAAEACLEVLAQQVNNVVDSAAVTSLQIELYTNQSRPDQAISIAIEFLARAGILWSPHPSDDDVRLEFERMWRQLGSRSIEGLLELPIMADPACSAILDVLTALHAPACFTDGNLLALIIARIVNLSIEHGNGDGSPLGYVFIGMILQARFGEYDAGFRIGKVGVDLVEQLGLSRFKAHAYPNFGNAINPWKRHVRTSLSPLRTALSTAIEAGHLTFAAYSYTNLVSAHLFNGDPLHEVQRFAETALAVVQKTGFGTGVNLIQGHLGLIRALRGLTPALASFDHETFAESQFEQHLAADPSLAMSECWYWIRKVQSCFLADDHVAALAAAAKAERLLWTSPGFLLAADYQFYKALSLAALTGRDRNELLAKLQADHRQIETWAGTCSANFQDRAVLVAAEIARIEDQMSEAMQLYDRAIRLAREHGFIQNEALANELAGRFYAQRGFEKIAHTYLRDARYCYLRWGADGKVGQLEKTYPIAWGDDRTAGPPSTTASSVEHLDLATVIKVSQAVSAEIVPEKLVDTLMRTAIEHAGAERAVLILSLGTDCRIEAEAKTSGYSIVVHRQKACLTDAALPESIIHYVMRTQESVILGDALVENPFSEDPYIRQCDTRSLLCLPLTTQAKLIGVLYLENNLSPDVFTSNRIVVLKVLASQAAISLENTRLYSDLEKRESKIRRLVDSDIIGIVIWDTDGRLIDANDAFLRMVQYERKDMDAGLRWFDMTPPEWQERIPQELEELRTTGTMQPCEKEYFRKDGSRVQVLIGAAAFDAQPNQGVAYILDLTERKRAEREARESERRYRELQWELAHANRVATMGQMLAWIAHDLKQPLTGVVMSGNVGLRWLALDPPDVAAAQAALDRVVKDGHRAAEILDRTRALAKKEPPQRELVDINNIISDTIALIGAEAQRNGIVPQFALTEALPAVSADRVQLQQVILNLLVNAIEAMSGNAAEQRELQVISGRDSSDRVFVAVRDSGPGVPQEHLDRLFEAFYTTKPGGMGMGLVICRTIIESYGGQLWATSNQPQGTTFQFSLPIDGGKLVQTS
jgi:PAS domain S-box-containing protein